jgi:hypothetical protein
MVAPFLEVCPGMSPGLAHRIPKYFVGAGAAIYRKRILKFASLYAALREIIP